jgi:type IV secretory pathway ATPase VirB11/archaellum biosynthesis ATPase
MSARRLAIRTAIRAATLVGAAAAALCIQLDGRGKMMRSPNGRCSRHDQSHSAGTKFRPDTIPLGYVELLTRRLRWLSSLTPGTAELLSRMIEAKLAFLISGGTGSGKTTLRLRHY